MEEIARFFPQLEILSCLGRGGMGVVYKARQISLGRLVALKLLAPEREKDPEFSERFAREAQTLAMMSHPHIVTVHDFGQAGGFFYLLMEYMDGANLRHLLQCHKFTPEQALGIVPPLCEALQYAHDRGIVHRDIKPENLLMDRDGRVKVADFGLAKMLGVSVNGDERAMGTLQYMAPEQAADPSVVDNRADIYSLGVVIYEMLTGELPGRNFSPPSSRTGVDSRLDDVVRRAMQLEPEKRYQQASVLKTEVEGIQRKKQVPCVTPARSVRSSQKAVSTTKDFRRVVIVMPAVAMMVVASLVLLANAFIMVSWTFLDVSMMAGQWGETLVGEMHPRGILLPVRLTWPILAMVLISHGIVFHEANQMRKLASWRSGMTASFILLLVSCLSFPEAFLRSEVVLPFLQFGAGLWGLLVLVVGGVKSHFDTMRRMDGREVPMLVVLPAWGLMFSSSVGFSLLLDKYGSVTAMKGEATQPFLIILLLLGVAASMMTFLAGVSMRSARARALCVAGAAVSILSSPWYLPGAAFGLWAIVVLFSSRATSEFRTVQHEAEGSPKKSAKPDTGCLIAAGCLILVLFGLVLIVGSLVFFFSIQRKDTSVEKNLQQDRPRSGDSMWSPE